MNVLLTSAGRRVELLVAFRRALQKLGIQGRVIAADVNPLAPTMGFADATYVVPRLDDPDYVEALLRICAREGVGLIVPLIDPDVEMLARNRSRLEECGASVAVIEPEASELVADKWLTKTFFDRIDVPTPASYLPGDPSLERVDFPLFIKPRRGSASAHTFPVRNRQELDFFREYVPDAIVQEYLPGPEITTDVICGLDGALLGLVSRRRIEVRGGEVSKGITVRDEAIERHVRRIAAELPARGPITVQCMMRDGEPRFTEINARFGGGVPLGIAAGVDGPALLLNSLTRTGGGGAALPEYQADLYVSRYDQSLFLTEAERERVASHHI